ncbi:FAD-dependent oxidoreductase [Allosaccharopolyspora coralli]|uniref:D-amino-acid oxidase n=1 Tax=Allosaccharopolyspora coralli TaxID=2665642 RepID=A0A5Q3QBJ6_9PSEU|nr:FAD-dependent oxidoreductase [Allosaccharopolyspora coralli]
MLVVGAGVQGLTTATVLAESGVDVRVRTAEAPRDTTSSVAAAMWGPTFLQPTERVTGWTLDSHAAFTALADEQDTGVRIVGGRVAARIDLGDEIPDEARAVSDLAPCAPSDLPAGFVSGYRMSVPLIDMPGYLEYLVDRLVRAGGRLSLSPVSTLRAATEDAPIVVNCTGVGAHELVGDPQVRPVRGQHVVVRNPGIEEYFMEVGPDDRWAGIFPHGERLILGGDAREHDWNRESDPVSTSGILRRCAAIDDRLAEPVVLDVMVGLRPGRPAVRLEIEDYEGARIVHNYGHGGGGVTLSWGCAHEAAALAAAAL